MKSSQSNTIVTPKFATVFLNRYCPRKCPYCEAWKVSIERILNPDEWLRAFDVLYSEGIKFFLILGNDILLYPWIIDLVKMLRDNGFYGHYAMYTTFLEPWWSKLRVKLIDAGLYSIAAGVDIPPGSAAPYQAINEKSFVGLKNLIWAKENGVPDVQATLTVHRYSWRYLDKLADIATKNKIWLGISLIEYSADGKHDFFGTYEDLKDFLIPKEDLKEFKKYMYWFADEVEKGRWNVQVPPDYIRTIANMGGRPLWHCSLPLVISVEADGRLRLCAYRPFYKHKAYVFDIGKKMSLEDYAKWYMEESKTCPGCLWSYPWMAEYIYNGKETDKIILAHRPKHKYD